MPFKDKELKASGKFYFCPPHAKFYEEHSWLQLFEVSATNESANNALLVQDKKDQLKEAKINSIIETSYKELDHSIQSIFSLFVPTEDYNSAKQLIDCDS